MIDGAMTDTDSRAVRAAHRREGEFPPAPEPLAVAVMDSHTHLDIVGGDAATQIAAAAAVGVTRIVQVGCDVPSSRWSAALAADHSSVVATVALHPNEAPLLAASAPAALDEALRVIEGLAAEPRVRAIGETGLDTFRTGDDGRVAQEASFRAHIALAKRFGKPLMIHDRDAHSDVLRVLDEEGAPDVVVLHCFSGDVFFATECVRRGYVLSFAGTVTFKNASALRDAARITPLDQLLVETDAPYLTPMPYRGRPNAPYLVPLTVRALAGVKSVHIEQLCEEVTRTAQRVFGSW
jgi:TatD DNase family protein